MKALVWHGKEDVRYDTVSDPTALVVGITLLDIFAYSKADNRDDIVPFNLEEELKSRGARYTKAILPLGKHVVEDGLLITGQNPASARGVGEAVARALHSQPQVREAAEAV